MAAGAPALAADPLAPKQPHFTPKAKRVILLWMQGGPSHIDSFDPKPDAPTEIRGEFKAINTSLTGVQYTEPLPQLARIAHQFGIIRGHDPKNGSHGTATGSPGLPCPARTGASPSGAGPSASTMRARSRATIVMRLRRL